MIRITDCESRISFVEAKMTPEQFGYAVTGMHTPDVKLRVMGLSSVGRKKINRTVFVEVPSAFRGSLDDARKLELCRPAIKRLKKETGLKWEPYLKDIGNYHKATKKDGLDGFNVHFTAFEKRASDD